MVKQKYKCRIGRKYAKTRFSSYIFALRGTLCCWEKICLFGAQFYLGEGKEKFEEGKGKFEEGKEKFEEGKEKLGEGKEKFEEGKEKLGEGKEKLGEG